jgi:hypothetical protein
LAALKPAFGVKKKITNTKQKRQTLVQCLEQYKKKADLGAVPGELIGEAQKRSC